MPKFKQGLYFVLTLIAIVSIAGCQAEIPTVHADVEREIAPPTDDVASLVVDNTEFAFDLYRQITQEQDGNFIFSPYSISQVFAMLYAGAHGETAAQIANTLHYALPQKQLHPAFNALDLTLQPLNKVVPTPDPSYAALGGTPADDLTLKIANSVWGQKNFPFDEDFLNILAVNYGAGLNLADFSEHSEEAQHLMSRWVEDATGGRIKNTPPPGTITPQTKLALANAIYFKGDWTYPFNIKETHDDAFHLRDGTDVTVPMMVDSFAYMDCVQLDGYTAVNLTYGVSRNAAMLILLPYTGRFQEVESELDASTFQNILAKLQTTNGLTFSMPRFKFDPEVDLAQTFSSMNMSIPFSEQADFTGISANGGLSISYAGHAATISVDENGTEATGATFALMAMSAVPSSCGNQVTANHPFIFVIYDHATSAILFLGRVMNPAA